MNKYRILTGVALLLTAAIGWGGMFPVAKMILPVVDAFYLAVIRYGFTAAVFIALLVNAEGVAALSLDGKGVRLALLGAAGFAGLGLLAFLGLAHSRPEHGAILMATQPLIAALLVWALRHARPSPVTIVSIAVAFLGVALVITRGHLTGIFEASTAFGDLLMFFGAICWVIYTLGAANFPGWSPLRYTTVTCMLGTPVIFAAAAVATLTGASHVPTLAAIASVGWQFIYIVVFASIVGVLAWNIGNQKIGSANGMLFINFVPITAFAIEIAQGHHFEPIELVGAAMVVGALVANTLMLKSPMAVTSVAGPMPQMPPHIGPRRPLCEVTN